MNDNLQPNQMKLHIMDNHIDCWTIKELYAVDYMYMTYMELLEDEINNRFDELIKDYLHLDNYILVIDIKYHPEYVEYEGQYFSLRDPAWLELTISKVIE